MPSSAKLFMQAKRSQPLSPRQEKMNAQERGALQKLQVEAKQLGATLHTDGRGGLPPSLVLGVLRRDGYTCKRCGGKADLTMHHKGGILASKWLVKKGHRNDLNNIVTICTGCHNAIHDDARAQGINGS